MGTNLVRFAAKLCLLRRSDLLVQWRDNAKMFQLMSSTERCYLCATATIVSVSLDKRTHLLTKNTAKLIFLEI